MSSSEEKKSAPTTEVTSLPPKSSQQFERKYGGTGQILASTLPFSLDVVGIVCGYAVCGVATPDAKPEHLFEFGSEGSSEGQFRKCAYGVAVCPSPPPLNDIWVSCGRALQVFDDRGHFKHMGAQSLSPSATTVTSTTATAFTIAFDVDSDSKDNAVIAFVADYANHCVLVCDAASNLIRKFGSRGSADGEFNSCWATAVDGQGQVYVCDPGNQRIQVFKRDGTFVRKFGEQGDGDGQFAYPAGIAFDRVNKELYVADKDNNRVVVFDAEGKYLRKFGSHGSEDGQFRVLRGVAVDSSGQVLVCDQFNHRISVFKRDGTYVTAWGTKGAAKEQFTEPRCVFVDGEGRIFVGDASARVQCFAFPV